MLHSVGLVLDSVRGEGQIIGDGDGESSPKTPGHLSETVEQAMRLPQG